MSEFQPLIDELYREQVRDARKVSMEDRFLGTFELIDFAFGMARGAVEHQFKHNTPEEREREWERRMRIARLLDEQGMYAPIESGTTS